MNDYIKTRIKEWKLVFKGLKLVHKLQPFLILIAVTCNIFRALSPFISLYYSSQIITELSGARDWNKIIHYTILTVLLNFFCFLLIQFLGQMWDILDYVLGHKIGLFIADKCFQLDYADMENSTIRETKEKLHDGYALKRVVWILPDLISNSISVILSVSLVIQIFISRSTGTDPLSAFLNSSASIVMLCIFLFITIFTVSKSNEKIQQKSYDVMHNTRSFQNHLGYYAFELSIEYNSGKDIRLYNQAPLIKEELHSNFDRILDYGKDFFHTNIIYTFISSIFNHSLTVLIYLFVGLKALTKAISIGNIVLYSGAVTQFGVGFSGISFALTQARKQSEYLEWFFDFVELPNHKETGTKRIDLEEAKNYEIEFRNVSFHYPSSENYSLEHLNIKFKVGEKMAVVGRNGSGKTTFIKLLCRLYDPQEGEILLNGINIKEYDYYDYLSLFSVVFQDFHLFSFTLGENVATSSDYDEKKVEDCTFKAGLEQRIERFPNGIKTQLYNEFAEEGVEISGGEAQKVAIARALYKNSPFIILDEPTAALDPIAEADIYSRLNDLIKDKTAVYISHRLSSCYFCKQIAVFDSGHLVQYGTHKNLVAKEDGLYYQLWNSQAQYYQ